MRRLSFLFLILFLLVPLNALAVTMTYVGVVADPAGGGVGGGAFAKLLYITSRNAVLSPFAGFGGGALSDNSMRLLELRKKVGGNYGLWTYVWCNEASQTCTGTNSGYMPENLGGIQTRDNYAAFYVPGPTNNPVDEVWFISGSHLPESWHSQYPNSDPYRSGRMSFANCGAAPGYSQGCATWPSRSTTNEGAFDGSNGVPAIIRGVGGKGWVYVHGSAPGNAWNANADSGLIFGGGGEGDSTTSYAFTAIVPNVANNICDGVQSGTARYVACRMTANPRAPSGDKWVFCGTSTPSTDTPNPNNLSGTTPFLAVQAENALVAGDGSNFYLYGTASSQVSAYSCSRTFWKFDATPGVGQWTELEAPPFAAFAPSLVYDSARQQILASVYSQIFAYNLTGPNANHWTSNVAPASWPSRWNQLSVYAPTGDVALFAGGADSNGQTYDFFSLDPDGTNFYIPPRTWVAVPYTGDLTYNPIHYAPCSTAGQLTNGCKHTRAWTLNYPGHANHGKIYFLGGDFHFFGADDSNRAPVYTFDISTIWGANGTGTWAHDYAYCMAEGQDMPGGPDEVGWIWDPVNHKFWEGSGYYGQGQTAGQGCGATIAWPDTTVPLVINNAVSVYWGCQTSNGSYTGCTGPHRYPSTDYSLQETGDHQLTLTRTGTMESAISIFYQPSGVARGVEAILSYDIDKKVWSFPSPTPQPLPWAGHNNPKYSFYDSVDNVLWSTGVGTQGLEFFGLHLATGEWTDAAYPCAAPGRSAYGGGGGSQFTCDATGTIYVNNVNTHMEYMVGSAIRRKLWVIDAFKYRLLEFDMDARTLTLGYDPPIPPGQETFINNHMRPATQDCDSGNTDCDFQDTTVLAYDDLHDKMYYLQCWPYPAGQFQRCHLDGYRPNLFIYDPALDDGTHNPWTIDPGFQPDAQWSPSNLTGGMILRGSTMVFNPVYNVLMIYGGQYSSNYDPNLTHFFLWRYGPAVTTELTDTTPPSITIVSPACATAPTGCPNSVGTIDVSGTASDNAALASPNPVTWANNRSGSGNATGTTSWSVTGIILQAGANVLTFTAHDAAGNTSQQSFTAYYSTGPGVVYQGAGKQTQSGSMRAN